MSDRPYSPLEAEGWMPPEKVAALLKERDFLKRTVSMYEEDYANARKDMDERVTIGRSGGDTGKVIVRLDGLEVVDCATTERAEQVAQNLMDAVAPVVQVQRNAESRLLAAEGDRDALKNDLADARTLLASPECFGNGPEWRKQVREFLDRARSPSHEFLAIIEEKKALLAKAEGVLRRIAGARPGDAHLWAQHAIRDAKEALGVPIRHPDCPSCRTDPKGECDGHTQVVES